MSDTIPRAQRKRVKTPTLLQMEAVECGAASLGIVLRHFGRFAALEELRLVCGVSRDGSNALNLVKAAREYGLKAKGIRRSSIKGLLNLPLPVIVFWKFTHFLVVEGFGKDRVYVNDPATGPRTVSLQEFDENFTGIVLLAEPGPDFEKGGERFTLFSTLRHRLAGSGYGLAYVLLASLFLIIPGLIVPAFLRIFVDDILVGGRDWITPLLIGMSAAVLLRAGLTWLQQMYLLRLETKLALSGSARFFWHILHLPIEFFTQRYAGDIALRVQINDRVAQLLSGELATTAINLLLVVFYALLMIQYDALLAVIGIGIVMINILALRSISRRRVDANRNLLQERGKLAGTAMDGLETIETMKATGAESDFFARWAGFQAKVVNSEQQLGYLTQLLGVVPPFLMTINIAVILVIGGLRVLDGQLTIGMLVAFQSLMLSFTQPVTGLINLASRLQEAAGDLNRLDDVLRYPADKSLITRSFDPEQVARLEGNLSIDNVSFGYNRLVDPLIAEFSLDLKPGQRVALVGASGSGKSTVAKLVAGLYPAWEGTILFDGQPRETIPRPIMTASVAMVDQTITLFAGSVRDNLTLWNPAIPKTWVIQAAKDACIHEVITEHPGGYDFQLKAGGRNFSGGERQRLEIARALATNPTLLVLDEATSALDPVTEKNIDDNLRRRGCTCLIIAHRLSTVRDCDEIIVMDRGRIVQRGTHQAMLDKGGAYADLIGAEQPTASKSVVDSMWDSLSDFT
ncbi:MAG: NHLP family bacteriocin export ABC transporter peptidase/permease/ATPase subunit [Anaerolineae bacterium]|nr:NHLP family bacteriocin export ABC transporter peptidase/permease/ATPase subunit [Anaerolineae bacterium]